MVAMYCLYHGRQGLRNIATQIHASTYALAESRIDRWQPWNEESTNGILLSIPGLKAGGNQINSELFFDTLQFQPKMNLDEIKQRAREKRINLRYYENGQVRSCEIDVKIENFE